MKPSPESSNSLKAALISSWVRSNMSKSSTSSPSPVPSDKIFTLHHALNKSPTAHITGRKLLKLIYSGKIKAILVRKWKCTPMVRLVLMCGAFTFTIRVVSSLGRNRNLVTQFCRHRVVTGWNLAATHYNTGQYNTATATKRLIELRSLFSHMKTVLIRFVLLDRKIHVAL